MRNNKINILVVCSGPKEAGFDVHDYPSQAEYILSLLANYFDIKVSQIHKTFISPAFKINKKIGKLETVIKGVFPRNVPKQQSYDVIWFCGCQGLDFSDFKDNTFLSGFQHVENFLNKKAIDGNSNPLSPIILFTESRLTQETFFEIPYTGDVIVNIDLYKENAKLNVKINKQYLEEDIKKKENKKYIEEDKEKLKKAKEKERKVSRSITQFKKKFKSIKGKFYQYKSALS